MTENTNTNTNSRDAERTDGGTTTEDTREGIPAEEVEPDPTPPPEDEADTGRADPSEMFVPRDENGEIAHVEVETDAYGTVVIQPMTYGHVERYLGDAGSVAQANAETVAEILRNHVIDPDLDAYAKENFRDEVDAARRGSDGPEPGVWFCAEIIRNHMNPYAPQALLMSVLSESGMDVDVGVDSEGEATIEFDNEGN